MSIFTRTSPQETSAARAHEKVAAAAQQAATVPPPADPSAPAGVLPPPAAPMYSTRAPSQPNVDRGGRASLTDKVAMARQQQQSVRERVRVGVQRAKEGTGAPEPRPQPPVQRSPAPRRPAFAPRHTFDPIACAQTGLLMLAWRWQEAGSPIRAIHAYLELLRRYPGTPAAAAAVADLVDLSEKLAEQGQFHLALAIYDHLECLA